ncbi:T9SS type A sorting domain-containing protein, partial [candidate division WOR-3 bacterium]|nr:T9SS type A sorting domain-containing protein [candidate division WOR-3 bacterium]
RGCPAIAAGRAIRYTTDEPVTGVVEGETGPLGIGAARLAIWPNPARAAAQVRFGLARAAEVRLAVYDRTGREVRRLLDGRQEPGEHRVSWNGRDALGRELASGVYFVRLAVDGTATRQKLVVSR